VPHYLSLLREDRVNVFTLHAEIEGTGRRALFRALLAACRERGVEFIRLDDYAKELLANRFRDSRMRSNHGRDRWAERICGGAGSVK